MTLSLRVIALVLCLVGVSRVAYADLMSVLPGMTEPTPVLSLAIGLLLIIAAISLFLGHVWGRWLSVIGAVVITLQGLVYVAWVLGHSPDLTGVLLSLIEPIISVLLLVGLLRHWPGGRSWSERPH